MGIRGGKGILMIERGRRQETEDRIQEAKEERMEEWNNGKKGLTAKAVVSLNIPSFHHSSIPALCHSWGVPSVNKEYQS
jgi:uncharacterized protein YbjQ (UPF0145 family)